MMHIFLPRHIIHAIYFQLVHLSMHLCTMYQTAIFSYLCGPYSNNSWSLFASAPRTMSRRPTSFCRSGRRWVTLRRPRRRKRMKLWNYADGFWGGIIHKMLFLIWHWHAFAYSIFFQLKLPVKLPNFDEELAADSKGKWWLDGCDPVGICLLLAIGLNIEKERVRRWEYNQPNMENTHCFWTTHLQVDIEPGGWDWEATSLTSEFSKPMVFLQFPLPSHWFSAWSTSTSCTQDAKAEEAKKAADSKDDDDDDDAEEEWASMTGESRPRGCCFYEKVYNMTVCWREREERKRERDIYIYINIYIYMYNDIYI